MIEIKPINKFKTYKFDAAPFFFYIDVFPPEYLSPSKPHLESLIKSIKINPIMPLPMRVDRVFNGEKSILIRPREPISDLISEEFIAIINPTPFLQIGIEKLLYFTEIRAREKLFLPLTSERVKKWWRSSRLLYGNISYVEKDFSDFLKAYLYTIVKTHVEEDDLAKSAIDYCKYIAETCKKRLEQNKIIIEVRGEQLNVNLYKRKDISYYTKFKKKEETQYLPELIDIEVYDLSEKGFTGNDDRSKIIGELKSKRIKYIPLLFYEDLLECMLQNLKNLENNSNKILDPSLLLEKKAIILEKPKEKDSEDLQKYSWLQNFESINFESILDSIRTTYEKFYASFSKQPLSSIR
ncbi:MAG: hypothetical protein JSV62_10830 [Promethearchaeota archaeon]|nr:MAG: hypothetical protein JSV62_10830 [Candidatus Lokiarchaeota archaeon]